MTARLGSDDDRFGHAGPNFINAPPRRAIEVLYTRENSDTIREERPDVAIFRATCARCFFSAACEMEFDGHLVELPVARSRVAAKFGAHECFKKESHVG